VRDPRSGIRFGVADEVRTSGGGTLPRYTTPGAAGADLCASEAVTIAAGERASVPTGIHLELPSGHVGLVWPRSGLAVRHDIDTLAGVVDSDYRGEVRVVLVNHGRDPFEIRPGDRVAQLLVQKVERVTFRSAQELGATDRGTDGFGSTGS
jgi:dUTP pyrophosphatase